MLHFLNFSRLPTLPITLQVVVGVIIFLVILVALDDVIIINVIINVVNVIHYDHDGGLILLPPFFNFIITIITRGF